MHELQEYARYALHKNYYDCNLLQFLNMNHVKRTKS